MPAVLVPPDGSSAAGTAEAEQTLAECRSLLKTFLHGTSFQKALDKALKEQHGASRLQLLHLIVKDVIETR